jgi:uncharacterized lipoprotein YddW (UPF0748 family)
MNTLHLVALAGLALLPGIARAQAVPSDLPNVPREMRGLWVATVENIDWPSKPGLPVAQQKAELLKILDGARAANMNAIVFQVRPAGDAMYSSCLEPWSRYLTGKQGQAPSPFYDPLEFAVTEAHKRGLELHAWFNPFRARTGRADAYTDPNHLSIRRPDLVKTYGKQLWMDPGESDVRKHSLAVMLDVVKRYDVDGIHMDDYFYPYQVTDANKKTVDFPDSASYAKYRALGGKLARDDWRRKNLNTFVSTLYKEVKKEKPWVKVGISPFGIWRPGYPSVIQGLDPYTTLYADSRTWLRNGWVDYFTPQLYWAVSRPHQSYPVLLKWWAEQNVKGRNLWPGNIFSLGSEEIARQIALTRNQPGATGNIFFAANDLMRNSKGVADALAVAYARPALMPAFPWLDATPPAAPTLHLGLRFDNTRNALTASWTANGAEPAWQWLVRSRIGGTWRTDILPFDQNTIDLPSTTSDGDVVTLCAVDRCGNVSAPAAATVSASMTSGM